MVRFKNFGVATLFCVFLVAAADYFGPSKGHPYYEAFSRILDAGVIGGVSALAIWLLILMISAPFLLITHFENKSSKPKEKESFHENLLKYPIQPRTRQKNTLFVQKKSWHPPLSASTVLKCYLVNSRLHLSLKIFPVR